MDDPINFTDKSGADPCEDMGYGPCSTTVTTTPPSGVVPYYQPYPDNPWEIDNIPWIGPTGGLPIQGYNTPSCGTVYVTSSTNINPACWEPPPVIDPSLDSQTAAIVTWYMAGRITLAAAQTLLTSYLTPAVAGPIVTAAGEVLRLTFGHGDPHMEKAGLDPVMVRAAIEASFRQIVSDADLVGEFWANIEVEGQNVVYHAYPLVDGVINIGTWYVPGIW